METDDSCVVLKTAVPIDFSAKRYLENSTDSENVRLGLQSQESVTYVTNNPSPPRWCLVTVLSALYGKLLLVIGIGFVTTEITTTKIPLYFYEGYFTYLYSVSILFLGFGCTCLIRYGEPDFTLGRARPPQENRENSSSLEERPDGGGGGGNGNNGYGTNGRRRRASFIMETGTGFGSLFFRLGFLGFGLAAMVYTGLEFGSFFEVPLDSPCHQILRGVNPILRITFTFVQMYFIFMASRISVSKFQVWAKFGLMHLVATNLGVWLKTLVQDSTQEFSTSFEEPLFTVLLEEEEAVTVTAAPDLVELYSNDTCQRQDIMGAVVSASAPYLCPFLIQFSLVGAAVFYIMWRSVGQPWELGIGDGRLRLPRRVDCVGASKGLFLGLFVLVTNVICLILFFVLVNRPRLHLLAIYLAHLSHAVVMLISLVAIIVGMVQVRPLLGGGGPIEVDRPLSKLLLHLATFGSFLYSVFGVLAGTITATLWHEPSLLLAAISGLSIVQVTVQSLFLLQVSDRWEARAALATPRPGSHAVTLLLICNVTMWIVATFEIQHGRVNPIQAEFYNPSVWSVIQAATLPLCIFYRFQSTVMLASLWKITCLSPSK